MNKTLAGQLRWCLEALRDQDEAARDFFARKKEWDDLRRPPSKRAYAGGKFSVGAFGIILGVGVLSLRVPAIGALVGFQYPWWLLGSLILAVIGGAVFGKSGAAKKEAQVQAENQRLAQKYADEMKNRGDAVSAACQASRERLYHASKEARRRGEQCGIHESYLKSGIVQTLLTYIETGRCDTLKEALNLFEQEQREEMRDAADAAHRRAMQQKADAIYEETLRSADAAEEAARSADAAGMLNAAALAVAASKKQSSDNDFRVV